MAGHAQLKFVMTECSKTQIRLTGLICIIKDGKSTDFTHESLIHIDPEHRYDSENGTVPKNSCQWLQVLSSISNTPGDKLWHGRQTYKIGFDTSVSHRIEKNFITPSTVSGRRRCI